MKPQLPLTEIRKEYCRLVRQELLGPGSEISIPDAEHELITSPPCQRYSVGILFPQKANMADAEETVAGEELDFGEGSFINSNEATDTTASDIIADNHLEEPSDEKVDADGNLDVDVDTLDDEVELSSQMLPSSFGMNFLVQGNLDSIHFNLECGVYSKTEPGVHAFPTTRDFDREMFRSEGLDNLISYDEAQHCFVPKAGIDSDQLVARMQEKRKALAEEINTIVGELDSLKPKDAPPKETESDPRISLLETKRYELSWQFELLWKMAQGGFVRTPWRKTYCIQFDCGHNFAKTEQTLTWGASDKIHVSFSALRRSIGDGQTTAITLMMVNQEKLVGKERPSERKCLFQPIISISSDDNAGMTFLPLQAITDFSTLDDEEKTLELQYRDKRTYATGLGVSATWDIDAEGHGKICTEFMPEAEVPSMDFTIPTEAEIEENTLSMRYLSDLDETPWDQKAQKLLTVCNAYGQWIMRLKQKPRDQKYDEIADKLIARCQESLMRMKDGLQVLNMNPAAQQAFLLANRAMYMQRFHIKLQEKFAGKWVFKGDKEVAEIMKELDERKANAYKTRQYRNAILQAVAEEKCNWRLFQLAFLLLSVTGVTEDQSAERDLVDLIWFPTGGGKTEAYLGLTAFTIFYRRLAHPNECDGTTVIMRYTLRLLTAQQFTRAATLICACEAIRKGHGGLGSTPISIGLWIGGNHTPNTKNEAKTCYRKLVNADERNLAYRKADYYKFQLLKCPWCGTQLTREVENKRLVGFWGVEDTGNFHCTQDHCAFKGNLPIHVVDEELYKHPPTLLFATVDKFAMLAWKETTRAFFAANDRNGNRCPELIIQDELHLISGALGTMVAMYETVIDELCSAKGVKPKIVASTATIRRATSQCGMLYNREVRQFPSPGIDADDSFFARASKLGDGKYGRLYIGVMPSGKTKATMQVRAIAALMQKIKDMDLDDASRDRYWTLTGYFNSLKDLGKCSTFVRDDVKDAIKHMKCRLASRVEWWTQGRCYREPCELTSRVITTDLNKTLDKLEKNHYSADGYPPGGEPVDIVLATNMISVGIDVARLNTMFMVGQPKLTSEYIQASSRVGRSDPGVIFVLYDASKSRDRSHYEQFIPYHESFYRYVEPTGVTPFSRPALDRCLHAVLVALLRTTVSQSAHLPVPFPPDQSVSSYTDKILERMQSVLRKSNPEGAEELDELVEGELDYARECIAGFLERWQGLSDDSQPGHFTYGEKWLQSPPPSGELRLLKPFGKVASDAAFDTLTSLRNVDGTVSGSVIVE